MARLCGAEVGGLDEGLMGAEETISEFVDDVDSPAVLRIAVESGLTFYDPAHVWLARSRGLELRTRDREVLRVCPDVAVAMPAV